MLVARTRGLVVDAYQVVGELLDGVGGGTRLHSLGIVGDEEGLLGLDDDDAFLALWYGGQRLESEGDKNYLRTFLPYKLLSSALRTMNFSPAMWRPVLWTCLTSAVSLNAVTTSVISAGETCGGVHDQPKSSIISAPALSPCVLASFS